MKGGRSIERRLSFGTASIFLFLVFLCHMQMGVAASHNITLDVRNPIYQNGILSTSEGGVIQGENIRIQAKNIKYEHKNKAHHEIHSLEAHGDLILQYKGRVFIGDSLEYDFLHSCGTVRQGKTSSGPWYIGGDQIEIHADGSYHIKNAFLTGDLNKHSSWDVHAGSLNVLKSDLVTAQNVSFRLFKIPTLWIPCLKWNFKKADDSVASYKFYWDRGQGPLFGMRYQLYSWRDLTLFGRIEYRWSTGVGGAIESEYLPPDSEMQFITRSYVGTDRLETAPNKEFRFRFEGAHHWKSANGKTYTALTWDKYSDVRMPSDFKSEDFEVGTAKRTLFYVHHEEPLAIFDFKARPRVNAFESIKQDLPTFYLNTLPWTIGPTGILSSFWLKGAYIDFAYSNQLAPTPALRIPSDYRSGRFEAHERLFRPFYFGPLTFTPNVGGIGVLYTNSASHDAKAMGLLVYGANLSARGARTFSSCKHLIEPYIQFSALTKPTVHPDEHYIFSIQDGYNQITQIQGGIRNLIFAQTLIGKSPILCTHLYANAFFSDPVIPQVIPRLYLFIESRLPSLTLSFENAWNFRNHVLDFSNARCLWTINENIGLTIEGRYRSKYDWRKADHENFILDVTRPESALLASPLSDRRITLLTSCFIRFSPLWECQIESHHGFYRLTEDPYNEFKIDLFTRIGAFKLRLSFSHTDKDDRISYGLDLLKK